MVYVYVSYNVVKYIWLYVDLLQKLFCFFNWKQLYKIYIFSSDHIVLIDRQSFRMLDDHYLNRTVLLSENFSFPTYTSVVVSSYRRTLWNFVRFVHNVFSNKCSICTGDPVLLQEEQFILCLNCNSAFQTLGGSLNWHNWFNAHIL